MAHFLFVDESGYDRRKDYAYLFERFFYFLEDLGPDAFGIAVFDELEKVQSHLLVNQMDSYFKRTVRVVSVPAAFCPNRSSSTVS